MCECECVLAGGKKKKNSSSLRAGFIQWTCCSSQTFRFSSLTVTLYLHLTSSLTGRCSSLPLPAVPPHKKGNISHMTFQCNTLETLPVSELFPYKPHSISVTVFHMNPAEEAFKCSRVSCAWSLQRYVADSACQGRWHRGCLVTSNASSDPPPQIWGWMVCQLFEVKRGGVNNLFSCTQLTLLCQADSNTSRCPSNV